MIPHSDYFNLQIENDLYKIMCNNYDGERLNEFYCKKCGNELKAQQVNGELKIECAECNYESLYIKNRRK
jgi:DNA-directed RNA polymerase subunit RPC12/RpoP